MKRIILAFFLAAILNTVNAQSLVGKWQEETPELSAGYLNVYEFLSDSTFFFKPTQYFGLKRIISIGGRYSYNKEAHTLGLIVEFSNEIVGGTFEREEESGEASDSWVINGGEIKKIKLAKPVKEVLTLEFGKSDKKNTKLVLLDRRKFYKVE